MFSRNRAPRPEYCREKPLRGFGNMNSPELTYSAIYIHDEDDEEIEIQHLVTSMEGVDLTGRGGVRLPRFVSYSDNRDFFYLTRRE